MGNYDITYNTADFTVNRATPIITVTGGTFIYDGNPHPTTATATGVGGVNVQGSFTFTYTPGGGNAPVDVGTYSVSAKFTSTDQNYTDASGVGSITIVQAPPTTLIGMLVTDIQRMNIPQGTKNSLTSKLDNAKKSLEKGRKNAAINQLNAFINEVNAQRRKRLTNAQADYLVTEAQNIISVIKL